MAFAAAGLILLVSGVVVVLLRRQVVTLRVDREGMTTADGVVGRPRRVREPESARFSSPRAQRATRLR